MNNKRGVTTLFLAIILSALILIETTYIAYVADLDRRMTLTRALKSQGEVYLAQYDRELLKTYGIYALNCSQLDNNVFDTILRTNGYEVGETMCVSGVYEFNTEDLRRVVATFYTYRTAGILFERFQSQIMTIIESVDEYGIFEYLNEFTSSSASEVLIRIIEQGSNFASDVMDILEELGINTDSDGYQFFINLVNSLGQIRISSTENLNDFNPSDMGFISSNLQTVVSVFETSSEIIDDYMLHFYLVDYASYNFDTRLLNDTTINGHAFTDFHEDNLSDTEYILTGLDGLAANAMSYYMILGLLIVENIAFLLLDSTKREIIVSAGEVLSAVVTALTGGALPLPAIVYEMIIVVLWAEILAYGNVISILSGEDVTFLEINGIDAITLNYRDCINVFMRFVPDNLLLERITSIINRDFSDYVTGLVVESNYGSRTLHYEARYDLYL